MTVRTTVKQQAELIKNGAKYQAVKLHVKKNQKFYLGVGVGAFVVMVTRKPAVHVINTVAPVISPVFHNNNSSNVFMGGHIHKILRCNETGEIFLEGVTETAKKIGTTLHALSRHINENPGYETINGLTYSIVGVGN